MVLWWVPEGHTPSLEEAEFKLKDLRTYGPTVQAFTFKKPYPTPGSEPVASPLNLDGACPAP